MIDALYEYLCHKPQGACWDELMELVFAEPGEDEAFGCMFLRRLLASDPRFVEENSGRRWRAAGGNLLERSTCEVPLVVVDLETTGQHGDKAGVTEIGAVRLLGGREVDRFESLVDPGSSIPPYVARLTGITDAMVTGAPSFDEVLPAFQRFAADSVLVAHNAAFDVTLLEQESRRMTGRPLGLPSLCTLKLARFLLPELKKVSLDALAVHFGLAKAARHRALADAELTAAVLQRLVAVLGERGVTTLSGLLAAQHGNEPFRVSKPKVRRRSLEILPEQPAVYWLRGQRKETLLVARAADVRSEVLGYFLDSEHLSRRQCEMIDATRDVEFRGYVSELEGAIAETNEIRRRKPRYNRGNRHLPRGLFVKISVRRPWPRVFVASRLAADGALYLGPLRGRAFADDAAALLAKSFGLRTCPGRLEPAADAAGCWLGEAGWCSSPCNGSIDEAVYAERALALTAALERGGQALYDLLGRETDGNGRRSARDLAVLGRMLKFHRRRHWLVNQQSYVAAAPGIDASLVVAVVIAGFCRGVFWTRTAVELSERLAEFAPSLRRRRVPRISSEYADISTILAQWVRRSEPGDQAVVFDLDEDRLRESLEAAAEEIGTILPVDD